LVLEQIKENNKISATELATKLNLSSRQCERIIASLKAKGLLIRVGSAKTGYWIVKLHQS